MGIGDWDQGMGHTAASQDINAGREAEMATNVDRSAPSPTPIPDP